MEGGGMERIVKRFETVSKYDLVDFESLDEEEKAAVAAAIEAQKQSTDAKWRVGAAVWDYHGHMIAIHNDERGPHGHAEQNAVRTLFNMIEPPQEKKIKILALAGARKGEEVIREATPYGPDASLDDIEWMKPCPKCLEYIHDRSANVEDVKILSVAATGQIIRTSLRSLLPRPHTSFQIPLKDMKLAPAGEGHESENETTAYLNAENGSLRKKIKEIMDKSSEDW